jgi:hypothetical protein
MLHDEVNRIVQSPADWGLIHRRDDQQNDRWFVTVSRVRRMSRRPARIASSADREMKLM